ncbi:MAG: aldo/keto reductase [Candidatus Brocadiia bacterium]
MSMDTKMPYGQVDGIDQPVSRIILGTMIVSTDDRERSFDLLDMAAELGCNTVDTALVYAGGNSERAIGQWMEQRGNRDDMVIISKGCHPNADREKVTPYDFTADLHDSLARLRTGYIDMYMLHRDNPEVEVAPIVEQFNQHIEDGLIGAAGASNWSHERIEEANEYAESHGLQGFAASSPHFSLAVQVENPWGPGCVGISGPEEKGARDWYRRTDMPVFAYSSLARGFFSGRITSDNYEEQKKNLDDACQKAYCHDINVQRLARAEKLAEEKNLSVPQLATAYVMNVDLNIFALMGVEKREEMESNIRAAQVELTEAEIDWLELKRDER